MPRNPRPNTNGLERFKKEQNQIKRDSVIKVLEYIRASENDSHIFVTKSEILRRANISKTFLRINPDIDEAIVKFLSTYNKNFVSKTQKDFSDSSKDILISSYKKRNMILEGENKKLKEEIKVLYGKLASRRSIAE